ncbi:MAG: N-acetylmuramoyl-L-alanine amidase [Bacteroidales bacterium]|nr:N-acetylmuramoyl-L-alanine amidase [Bacteroidales bacterium]
MITLESLNHREKWINHKPKRSLMIFLLALIFTISLGAVSIDLSGQGNKTGGKSVKTYAIFGDQYEKVTIIDSKLQGAVYYLVSGHGGPDPGAVVNYEGHILCEDEYAYDVTLRLARELISHGALVYLITRDKNDGIRDAQFLKKDYDEVCYPKEKIPINQNKRLIQRKDAVNRLAHKHKGQFQRLVVIHLDSRPIKEKVDIFFYHDSRSKRSANFANTLKETLEKKYAIHQPGRGYKGSVSTRNLFMVRATVPVSTFIELGNISNTNDQKRFIQSSNRQVLAEWLCDGMIKDFQGR